VPIARTHDLLVLLTRTLDALVIDPKRSLAEVNREYSAMTNLAEFLVQRANVPFREAHEFASHLTDFGRRRGLAPTQIAFSDASSVYRETLGVDLPLSSSEFAAALDPAAIVAGRAGLGGPQPDEVRRMMSAAESNLDAHGAWLGERRERLTSATTRLESEFREACAAVEV
jgi:argininosuccinate lyase